LLGTGAWSYDGDLLVEDLKGLTVAEPKVERLVRGVGTVNAGK
jgi:hypothetical protein